MKIPKSHKTRPAADAPGPAWRTPAIALGLLGFALTASARAQPVPASAPASQPAAVLIHLPGIAGEMAIDRSLCRGLVAGGVASAARIIDWTGDDRGVRALTNVDRHRDQSARLADAIIAILKSNPKTPIVLVAHSGGTGVAVGALERLPAGVNVRTLVLLASALSPTYDLSKALSHVDGRAVALYSRYDDWVLGVGTKSLGTYDRQYVEAAGKVGFARPPAADAAAYARLLQLPYDPAWASLGHGGDHIGVMSARFAKTVLSPLIADKPLPTTWPSGR